MDNASKDLNESLGVNIKLFDIIYKLTDWLKELIEERRPRQEIKEIIGELKVLKIFGETKGKRVIGGKVIKGRIAQGSNIKIIRRDFEIGTGKIVELQLNKIKVKEVLEDTECGALIETKVDVSSGDILESFLMTLK